MNLLETKAELNKNLEISDTKIKRFCASRRNALGLLGDDSKALAEYQDLKASFNHDFEAVRAFNQQYAKLLRKV